MPHILDDAMPHMRRSMCTYADVERAAAAFREWVGADKMEEGAWQPTLGIQQAGASPVQSSPQVCQTVAVKIVHQVACHVEHCRGSWLVRQVVALCTSLRACGHLMVGASISQVGKWTEHMALVQRMEQVVDNEATSTQQASAVLPPGTPVSPLAPAQSLELIDTAPPVVKKNMQWASGRYAAR